ncbi:hypothetical protein [Vulgatibacter sp.]|uniref:hypothetical protein n=1 Tax=Vulgatibacter sp. TaxID=1971226 RepID=UPI0035686E2C
MIRAALAALLLLALLPAAAKAQPGEHLRLEAATAVPIYVGGRLAAELPARLRLSTSVGILPAPYVDGINELAIAFDAYDDDTADVIEDSLSSSLVWRTHLGWRPFAGAGFYFEGGYGLVTLGGGTSEAALIALAFGLEPPDDAGRDYDVDATLHMLDAELGWEWWIDDVVSIRTGLGIATTLGSSATVEPRNGALPVISDAFAAIAERELEEILDRYVHTPTVSFAVGYRIF